MSNLTGAVPLNVYYGWGGDSVWNRFMVTTLIPNFCQPSGTDVTEMEFSAKIELLGTKIFSQFNYAVQGKTVTTELRDSETDLFTQLAFWPGSSELFQAGTRIEVYTVLGTTGMTGKATGVHLHLGLKKLSGGDYIDPEKWSKDVLEKMGYTAGDYKVVKVTKAGVLRIRKGAGKMYAAKKFAQLTEDAQKKILKAAGKKMDGYVKGMEFSVTQIKGNWGKTPSGWIYLKYCERI